MSPIPINTSIESCLLTLDYAWYHVLGCSLQLIVLFAFGKTQFFTEAHNFGLFAMLADYGNMYLVKGTRTLQVLYEDGMERGDTDDLHGVGVFLFFLWFDYLGAVALIVFARHVGQSIHEGKFSVTSMAVILFHSLTWWTAPIFSRYLKIDNRTLLLSRESPKMTYIILFLVFTGLLHYHQRVTSRHYFSIIGSGISCGLLHHAALFVHGMRGYESIIQLLMTVVTEWPALLCAEDYIRNNLQQIQPYHARLCQTSMVLLLVAMMIPHLPSIEELTEYMITTLPGVYMQALGTAVIRIKTCLMPQSLISMTGTLLDCRLDDNHDTSIWLISTTSKSGAVISAKLLLDIASLCGYCLGSGSRDKPGIPGIVHAPSYPGQLLHAADMTEEWPAYVGATVNNHNYRCISMTRDPLQRLRSFYTYSRSGGEHWVRYETDLMQSLREAATLKDSIQLFWNRAGKDYLISSHNMFRNDLVERNCTEVRFEDLMTSFQPTLRRILTIFQVQESAIEPLVQRMMRHDRTNIQAQILAKDPHASSKKFSKEFLRHVERILEEDHEEIASLIRSQRQEMIRWREMQYVGDGG